MSNISVDQLANEIAKGLAEYTQDVIESIDEVGEKIAKKAIEQLKETSPKSNKENAKKYAKGWAVKTDKKFGEIDSHIIYNKNKPQLTHLLEHGHAKRGGGRVQGKPHIRPVEQQIIEEFTSKVEKVIKGG